MKKQVLILGGGFAGLGAARKLAGISRQTDVTLLDSHPYTTMVPSLPDLAGTRIPAEYLTEDLDKMVDPGINIVTSTVQHINMNDRTVSTGQHDYLYDYLVLATGSVTNLFGFDQHLESIHKLDVLEDGERIAREFPEYLERAENPQALVIGGGYTGLELGCNLRYCAHSRSRPCDISIVELKETILPGMPEAIRKYMEKGCREHNLSLRTGCSVDSFDGVNVRLSDGTEFNDVFLCWSTGTKFGLDLEGKHETIRDGRVIVDECLRVPQHPEVYAAGDAAAMDFGRGYLRKAVNFSLYSGRHAGQNITRIIKGRTPVPWSPQDLGWIIPFCNTATGKLPGKITVRGRFPLALHYFMCGYRNYNPANRNHFFKMAFRSLAVGRT